MNLILLGHTSIKDIALSNLEITIRNVSGEKHIVGSTDYPLYIDGFITHQIGISEGYGYHHINRSRYAAKLASEMNGITCIAEYDSIVISIPTIEENKLYTSHVFNNADSRFKSQLYAHCPYIASKKTWKIISSVGNEVNEEFIDRWIGYICELKKLEMLSTGYSMNTIDKGNEYNVLDNISEMKLVHGIKSIEFSNKIKNRI